MNKMISSVLVGLCAMVIAGLALVLPAPVSADVVATGSWEIHQDEVEAGDSVATDLHFTIYQKESGIWIKDYEITVEIVGTCSGGVNFADTLFTTHDDGHGDGKIHAVDCEFSNGSIPYCCKVKITAKLTLSSNNAVRIKDVKWTFTGGDTDDNLPDNGFWACKPDPTKRLKFRFYFDGGAGFTITGARFYTQGSGYIDSDSLWNFEDWDFDDYMSNTYWLDALTPSYTFYVKGFASYNLWLYFRLLIIVDGDTMEVRGEHESNEPTYVDLTSFEAVSTNGYVTVSWGTASEVDNAGFNVYRSRSTESNRLKINKELVASRALGFEGGSYSLADHGVANGATYYYWLEEIDIYGNPTVYGPVSVTVRLSPDKPREFILAQNYPNPFDTGTHIGYGLPVAADVRLSVYNAVGQKVRTLVDDHQESGYRVIHWDGKNEDGAFVSGGAYFCIFEAGNHVAVKKMVFSR